MHSTALETAIATTSFKPVMAVVSTPQRKARYSDKNRERLKDVKNKALLLCGCRDTAEIKQRLKVLGIKLDLRLTAAWIAIVKELKHLIANLAIMERKAETPTPDIKKVPRVKPVKPPTFDNDIDAMNWVLNTYMPVPSTSNSNVI